MAPADGADLLNIEVAYSPQAGQVHQVSLKLPIGATLRQALEASQLLTRCPELDPATGRFGVWGKARPLDWPLRDQDRVEIYRPLRVDPKEARRQRQRRSLVKR